MQSLLLVLLNAQLGLSFVIAPPWADQASNPCSKNSWQLVYWPPTKLCYQIFSRGPCPPSQELAFNPLTTEPECGCPANLPLHWENTDTCYAEFSRGPCEVNEYLVVEGNTTLCAASELCEAGSVFWPRDQTCYQLYTQGPCHKGDLLIRNPDTAEPYCGCDSVLLNQYYYSPLKLCYEHFTKGPCELGSLFTYNHSSETTDCGCDPTYPNYFKPLGQCFELGSKGPCGPGQVFRHDSGRSGCQCKEDYVYWEKTRACYREFTPGPCRPGQFLVKGNDGVGFCSKNPCSKAHLYFPSASDPSQGHCHKVGGQGPCPSGDLVVFEAYSGKSYRGDCGCSPGYNQNYWPEDGRCYEWYSQGPCPPSFMFRYNKEERRTECRCDTAAGFVFWNETGRCYRVYTQGPCPDNAWLIPTGDLSEVYCECRNGFYFAAKDYLCKRSPQIHLSKKHPGLRNHRFDVKDSNRTKSIVKPRQRIGKTVESETSVRITNSKYVRSDNQHQNVATYWDSSLGAWKDRR